jgi:plasmid stabilization system protein ParE
VTEYRLVAEPRADLDVAAAYQWYAVYFAVEADAVVILAVLHASRDPAEWQRLRI